MPAKHLNLNIHQQKKVALVSKQIKQFNAFIKEQAAYYKAKGINITLVDAYKDV